MLYIRRRTEGPATVWDALSSSSVWLAAQAAVASHLWSICCAAGPACGRLRRDFSRLGSCTGDSQLSWLFILERVAPATRSASMLFGDSYSAKPRCRGIGCAKGPAVLFSYFFLLHSVIKWLGSQTFLFSDLLVFAAPVWEQACVDVDGQGTGGRPESSNCINLLFCSSVGAVVPHKQKYLNCLKIYTKGVEAIPSTYYR